MSTLRYWIWLSAARAAPAAKSALLAHYGDAEAVFFAPAGDYAHVRGVGAADAARLEKRDLSDTDRILGACERQGLRVVTLRDAAYPRRLRNIYAPPAALYIKGRLPALDDEAVIAVIGTRAATPYGMKMARSMAAELSRCGAPVLSGLTGGIDAAAAEGALKAGGYCLGVLGTPHELARSRLAEEAAARGCLISEYPPGTLPQKSFFRERNRLSAGLSVGVVVVEAPEKSGALLFAAEALEQGKEIFAVPGNADSANSAGTLQLMQQGAKPVRSGWDVLCEFTALYPGKLHPAQPAPAAAVEAAARAAAEPPAEEKDIDKPQGRAYIDLREQLSRLSEDQLKILTAVEKGSSHIDDIIEASGLSTAQVLSQLTVLEIKGFLRRQAGRRVALNLAKK